MDTETMIQELKRIEEKHKHDKVFTGHVNIAEMAHDVRKRLEELKPYEDTGLTPEQIVSLKEQDTAKPPIEIEDDYGFFVCPSCGNSIYASDDFESHKFCLNCGQRILWKEGIDGK